MPEVKLGSNRKKSFLKVPTPIDGFNTDSTRPRSTTSRKASLVWEDGFTLKKVVSILSFLEENMWLT